MSITTQSIVPSPAPIYGYHIFTQKHQCPASIPMQQSLPTLASDLLRRWPRTEPVHGVIQSSQSGDRHNGKQDGICSDHRSMNTTPRREAQVTVITVRYLLQGQRVGIQCTKSKSFASKQAHRRLQPLRLECLDDQQPLECSEGLRQSRELGFGILTLIPPYPCLFVLQLTL